MRAQAALLWVSETVRSPERKEPSPLQPHDRLWWHSEVCECGRQCYRLNRGGGALERIGVAVSDDVFCSVSGSVTTGISHFLLPKALAMAVTWSGSQD